MDQAGIRIPSLIRVGVLAGTRNERTSNRPALQRKTPGFGQSLRAWKEGCRRQACGRLREEESGDQSMEKHHESRSWSETSAKLFWKIIGYSLVVERKGRKKLACHFLCVSHDVLPAMKYLRFPYILCAEIIHKKESLRAVSASHMVS